MGSLNESIENRDKRLVAACGLFCPACTLYIATLEDPKRLKRLAKRFQLSEEKVKCYGCHSDKRGPYCKTCKMVACAAEKGIDFCGECDTYPCEELKTFQEAMPHRIELWSAQERIKNAGYKQWFQEMVEEFSCPHCDTINSAYDLTCRNCGNDPGCDYVRRHKDAIMQHPSKLL